MNRAAVILAGGAGTRLWPLSSDDHPKQFLRLFEGRSLLQRTWDRVARLLPASSIYVSTNERYREKCLEQLPDLAPENVVAEPARRNTGPAIALCSFAVADHRGDDVTLAFLASDHAIADEDEFARVLDRAFDYAASHDELMTIGIAPTEPNTGYGYLEVGEPLDGDVARVRAFTEKPERAVAEEFLRRGNYTWNASMFVWRAEVFRRELALHAPELAHVSEETYESSPSISIDYALMEKSSRVATIRGDFGWSDVGSWAAVARLAQSSPAQRVDAENVFVLGTRPVAVVGVSNVAVIESDEGVLVIDLAKAELVKKLS